MQCSPLRLDQQLLNQWNIDLLHIGLCIAMRSQPPHHICPQRKLYMTLCHHYRWYTVHCCMQCSLLPLDQRHYLPTSNDQQHSPHCTDLSDCLVLHTAQHHTRCSLLL